MHILFLNSLKKHKWGGGEKWMVHAGMGLKSRGHRVTIACLPGSAIERHVLNAGLASWHFGIPADVAFWKIAPLKSFIKKNRIDAVICCQNKDVKIGGRAARQAGVGAIFARQGLQNLTNKKKYITPFTKYIDSIITNSSSIREVYEGFGWFPDHFIHVIYNGVDIPTNVLAINLHEQLGLGAGAKIIFSAGRLDYQKGFDLLIEVAVLAKKQNLKWNILIAGEGKLKAQLTGLAREKGVGDSVRFIGFSDNIPSLLQASDVFVLPSRYEGMPNALLEAMAMGKASVATRVNGAPELVENGISGFLVDPESPQQIFQKLKALLDDDAKRASMEKAALQRVKEHFTFEKMTDHLEQLLLAQLAKTGQN